MYPLGHIPVWGLRGLYSTFFQGQHHVFRYVEPKLQHQCPTHNYPKIKPFSHSKRLIQIIKFWVSSFNNQVTWTSFATYVRVLKKSCQPFCMFSFCISENEMFLLCFQNGQSITNSACSAFLFFLVFFYLSKCSLGVWTHFEALKSLYYMFG